jgi:hypothetical protein
MQIRWPRRHGTSDMDKMGRGDILLQIHTYKYSTRFSFGRRPAVDRMGERVTHHLTLSGWIRRGIPQWLHRSVFEPVSRNKT